MASTQDKGKGKGKGKGKQQDKGITCHITHVPMRCIQCSTAECIPQPQGMEELQCAATWCCRLCAARLTHFRTAAANYILFQSVCETNKDKTEEVKAAQEKKVWDEIMANPDMNPQVRRVLNRLPEAVRMEAMQEMLGEAGKTGVPVAEWASQMDIVIMCQLCGASLHPTVRQLPGHRVWAGTADHSGCKGDSTVLVKDMGEGSCTLTCATVMTLEMWEEMFEG
jgi:hypothetical protein